MINSSSPSRSISKRLEDFLKTRKFFNSTFTFLLVALILSIYWLRIVQGYSILLSVFLGIALVTSLFLILQWLLLYYAKSNYRRREKIWKPFFSEYEKLNEEVDIKILQNLNEAKDINSEINIRRKKIIEDLLDKHCDNFKEETFKYLNLSDFNFNHCVFDSCDFSRSDFSNTTFKHCDFYTCSFYSSIVCKTDFSKSKINRLMNFENTNNTNTLILDDLVFSRESPEIESLKGMDGIWKLEIKGLESIKSKYNLVELPTSGVYAFESYIFKRK